jgi:hypothetical protein
MIKGAHCSRTAPLLFVLLLAAGVLSAQASDPGQVSLTVYPARVALNPGQTQRFSAHVDGAPAGAVIRWTITGRTAGGSISQGGVFTARTLGVYRVVAYVPLGEGTVARTATVTVLRPLDF